MLPGMPIYEYRCAGCDERFEELVRRPEDSVACPECDGAQVTRLLSTFAGVGGAKQMAKPDPSRLMADVGRSGGGGCCGGGCGHAH